jgi:hypothetical protein
MVFAAFLASVVTSEVYSLAIDDGKISASTCTRFAVEAGLLFAMWRGLRWARWSLVGYFAVVATLALYALTREFTPALVALATYYVTWAVTLTGSRNLGAFQRCRREKRDEPQGPTVKFVIFLVSVVAIPALIMNWMPRVPAANMWLDLPNNISIRTEFFPAAQSVPKQLVGFAKGITQDGLQLPTSVEFVTIRGLRGVCYRGDSLNRPRFPKFAATLLFGKKYSYMVFAVGRVDLSLSEIEAHCDISDSALFDSVSVNASLVEELKIGIPEMQRIVLNRKVETSKLK